MRPYQSEVTEELRAIGLRNQELRAAEAREAGILTDAELAEIKQTITDMIRRGGYVDVRYLEVMLKVFKHYEAIND